MLGLHLEVLRTVAYTDSPMINLNITHTTLFSEVIFIHLKLGVVTARHIIVRSTVSLAQNES